MKKIWNKVPRGIRNHNPLNIRRNPKQKWVGEVEFLERAEEGELSTKEYDQTFCQFSDIIFGWRAAFITLHTYITKHKCNTITKIINRWAPPSENATKNYINTVSFYSNVEPDTEFDFWNKMVILKVAAAMCVAENGAAFDPLRNTKEIGYMEGGYEAAKFKITHSDERR